MSNSLTINLLVVHCHQFLCHSKNTAFDVHSLRELNGHRYNVFRQMCTILYAPFRAVSFIKHFFFMRHLQILINNGLYCLLINFNKFKPCDQLQHSCSNLRNYLGLIIELQPSNPDGSELSGHLLTLSRLLEEDYLSIHVQFRQGYFPIHWSIAHFHPLDKVSTEAMGLSVNLFGLHFHRIKLLNSVIVSLSPPLSLLKFHSINFMYSYFH